MDKDAFDELKTTGKLPTPAGVAIRIVELARSERVRLADLAHVVQSDPALAGRLIKFANSALAGPRRPVVAVADAVQLLGTSTVRQLALGFSVLDGNRTGGCRAFDYEGFWSRSLATAIAVNALCLRTRAAPADEAFTCGLLASLGRLALATLHPVGYAEVLESYAGLDSAVLRARERQRFQTDHSDLCAALLEDWMLPRVFVGAVYHHEDPADAPFPEGSREAVLTRLLHVARQVSAFCMADEAERRQLAQDLVFGAAQVGIDADAIALLTDEVAAQWRDWGSILMVKTAEAPPFSSLSPDLPAEGGRGPVEAIPAAPPTVPAPSHFTSLSVLLVDDDPVMLALLEPLLAEQGHRVAVARDGAEALRMAIATPPQLIVCDWVMPGLDGLGLCRALRESEAGRQIYFLLLTGMESDEHLVEAFEAGVDDFIVKPFSPRVLLARLRAGQRVVHLQQEAARDSHSLRRFATELAVANRRLRQAALTDPLTGLPNRRYAMERLEQEWSGSARTHRPLSLLMVDIDRFKLVNDTHGHDSGDLLLRQVALLMRRAARAEDVICRLGGEEFLVISPDTALAAAANLGERLRRGIGDAPVSLGSLRCTVTVSIGAAQRTPVMTRHDELLKAADEMLYHAKRMGGNRVEPAGALAETGEVKAAPSA